MIETQGKTNHLRLCIFFQATVAILANANTTLAIRVVEIASTCARGRGVGVTGHGLSQHVLLREHHEELGLEGHGLVEPH